MGIKKTLFVLMVALCAVSLANVAKKGKKTKTNMIADKIKHTRRGGKFEFPDELEFDFAVKGEYEVRARSSKMRDHKDMPTADSSGKKNSRSRKNQEFYADQNGAYQVMASEDDAGNVKTDVKALYRNGKGEKCFYARDESYCWYINGTGEFKRMSFEGDVIEGPPELVDKRKKRSDAPLVYTDFNPDRVFKVVYIADRAFMDWFRALNSNNDAQAIEDAEDYIYMLNNELTYLYRGIKEVSEAEEWITDMDITVFAQGFYYPTLGTEWTWLSSSVSGDSFNGNLNYNTALGALAGWVDDGNVDGTGPFDTATLVSPLNMEVLGVAYIATVCNPSKTNLKVSLNQDRFYDVALTAAHELGHSLASQHDGGSFNNCPNVRNIMSTSAFNPSSSTQDEWNRWSTCSVEYIVNHVLSYQNCLLDVEVSDNDFYDQLCRGVRGAKFDIDFQCKAAFKLPSSVACSPSSTVSTGKVSANACWDDGLVTCTNANGACNLAVFTIYDGTPCQGTNSNLEYVCYRGDCLEKVDVCAGRSSTTSPGPTVGVTTTTTTPLTTTVSPTTTTPLTTTVSPATTTTPLTTTVSPTTTTPLTTTVSPTSTSPFTTTEESCDCTRFRRRSRQRRRCCRRNRNDDGGCCFGCRRTRRGNSCRPGRP